MIEIFLMSFFVALSGALSPGPLLTFTIYKSIKQKRGYLAGVFIILGHATIELTLIIGLLVGASLFFLPAGGGGGGTFDDGLPVMAETYWLQGIKNFSENFVTTDMNLEKSSAMYAFQLNVSYSFL